MAILDLIMHQKRLVAGLHTLGHLESLQGNVSPMFLTRRRHWKVAFSRFDRVTYVSVTMALQNSVVELYD